MNKDLNEHTSNREETTQNKIAPIEKESSPQKRNIESNIPRGQRGDFQKLTITMPSDMIIALKTAGLNLKAAGNKDCDTSALIREAVVNWLGNQSTASAKN